MKLPKLTSELCSYSEASPHPEPAIAQREPDVLLEVGDALVSPAWVVTAPGGADVERVTVLLHGWNSSPRNLGHFAEKLAGEQPGTAVVLPEQPKIHLPDAGTRQDVHAWADYAKKFKRDRISAQRAATAAKAGRWACQRFGLDSLSVITHSAGTIDGANMALRMDGAAIDSFTAFAGAGLLDAGEVAGTVLRRVGDAARNIRKLPLPKPQLVSEAVYALSTNIASGLQQLSDYGTPVYGIDFAGDVLFPPEDNRPSAFRAGHLLVHNGCACHSMVTHPGEASHMVALAQRLWRSPAPIFENVGRMPLSRPMTAAAPLAGHYAYA